MKNQKGAVGVDTYFNLTIVMMFLVIFLVALTGVMAVFDARADLQNVAEFVGQQYRDEGCISGETKDVVHQLATSQKMDITKLVVNGEDSSPLPYHTAKMISITYGMQIPVFPGVKVPHSLTLPIPIVSQFVPSPLLHANFACVAM